MGDPFKKPKQVALQLPAHIARQLAGQPKNDAPPEIVAAQKANKAVRDLEALAAAVKDAIEACGPTATILPRLTKLGARTAQGLEEARILRARFMARIADSEEASIDTGLAHLRELAGKFLEEPARASPDAASLEG